MAAQRAMMFAEYFHRRNELIDIMRLMFRMNEADPMFQRLQRDREDMDNERAQFFTETPLLDLFTAYHHLVHNAATTPWPFFMLHGLDEFHFRPIAYLIIHQSSDFEHMRTRLHQLDDVLAFLQQHGNLDMFPLDRIQRLRDALQQRLDTVMQGRTDALFMATHSRLGGRASIHQISADLLQHINDQV